MIPPFGTMATREEQAEPFPGVAPSPASPIATLTVEHVCLDSERPTVTHLHATRESLLYALTGRLRVYANGLFLGTLGGRSAVTEPLAHVLRFPAGTPYDVTVLLEGWSADYLWVACEAIENRVTKLPFLHWNDTFWHTVGTGTHERRVGEVQTPTGFRLSVGETLNCIGGTSSYPAHASTEDLLLYQDCKTTWDEKMFFVCPQPATAVLYGFYPGATPVNETITIPNGTIAQMPLGSHFIQAHPSTWAWYWWGYCGNALTKRYNKHATDLGVYRQ